MLPGMYQGMEEELFYTELVGVDEAGNIVARFGQSYPNASFYWSSNQTAGWFSDNRYSGGIYFSTLLDEGDLPPLVSGGLAIEPSPVPVPGAALLGVVGLALAGWRLRRREAGQ